MHQTHRGIDQKTIIQHILRFSDEDECFQKFRLVCKIWKDAVETIRFDRVVGDNGFFYNWDQMITSQEIVPVIYFRKYLKLFRKLHMQLENMEHKNTIFPFVLNNMKKLNEITFATDGEELGEEFDPFAFQMLQNSNKTLRTLNIPKFVIPDIAFPKLTNLHLSIGVNNILSHEFQNCFPTVLRNMENLETIEIHLKLSNNLQLCQQIYENYAKNCISANSGKILNVIPVKILTCVVNLNEELDNKLYTSHVQYMQIGILFPDEPMVYWNRYKEIFDQCTELKAIALEFYGRNFLTGCMFHDLEIESQRIWNERISYFESRGISIVDLHEIDSNIDLRTKLSKEAGATWKFHFDSQY